MNRWMSEPIEPVTTTRRTFLKLMGGAGAGLTLAMSLPTALAGDNKWKCADNASREFEPNAFVRIDADSRVTVVIKHIEMGQGTFTGLATLVAEEMDADWEQVRAENAPADAKRYNNLLWGSVQGTGGSSAIANAYMQMRQAGATAKAMLVTAAAQQWGVPTGEITVNRGEISHSASAKTASFGEMAEHARKLQIPSPDSIKLKDPSEFVYIGKTVSRMDTGKTDGSAIFTQDIQLEGMLTALVAHPPKFGATLKSMDDSETRKSNGVVDVVKIPSGVAVLAKDFWSAKKGRDKLQLQWDESSASKVSSTALMQEYRAKAEQSGTVARNDGDASLALKEAEFTLDATYEFPYLAHAAMEPMNCVALINEQGCELYNGEQLHTIDQIAVSKVLGIKPDQVKINTLYAGGSFGRRGCSDSDYIVEAVQIARAKPGIPVKLVWTREDDTRAGYFRPAYVHRLKGGLDTDGNIIGWYHHIVGQDILAGTVFDRGGDFDPSTVEGAYNLPYAIPNLRVESTSTDPQVPVLWWRSVGHTHTAFSTETFLDELAAKAGKDPFELRMQLLKDHPRWQGVLKLAAEKADWGKPLAKGSGRGIAVHKSFNTYVAQVAEVSVKDNGSYTVDRVVCAVDCGVAVNPDIIRSQMEGGIGFGMSPALVSAISMNDGKVVESNFHDYQVLRINQMPEVEVHIVPSAEPPTGVGEPGVPPIAPAIANALAAVTGQRYYQLPIKTARNAS